MEIYFDKTSTLRIPISSVFLCQRGEFDERVHIYPTDVAITGII